MSIAKPLETFLTLIDETPELWRSVMVRTLAVSFEGRWHNVLTSIRLSASEPGTTPSLQDLPNSPVVRAWDVALPSDQITTVLGRIAAGSIELDGTPIQFETPATGNQPAKPYESRYLNVAKPLTRPIIVPAGTPVPVGHLLGLNGPSATTVLAGHAQGWFSVDDILRALDAPWDGLESVQRVAFQALNRVQDHAPVAVEVIAPLDVRFEDSQLRVDKGRLHYTIRAHAYAVSHVRLGYLASSAHGYRTDTHIPQPSRWRGPADGMRVVRGSIRLPKGTAQVVAMLRVGRFVVQRVLLDVGGRGVAGGAASPRLAAFALAAGGAQPLRDVFHPKDRQDAKTKKVDLEHAVARVFSLAGFRTDVTGGYGVTDGADVLAMTPDGSVLLVIECTVGALNYVQGKPVRLLDRVEALRGALAPWDTEVSGVMAALRPMIADSEQELAGLDGLAVLDQDSLGALCDLVLEGVEVPAVIAFCRERIPVSAAQQANAWQLARGRRR